MLIYTETILQESLQQYTFLCTEYCAVLEQNLLLITRIYAMTTYNGRQVPV